MTLLDAFARQARRAGISRGVRLVDERGRGTFLAYSELLVRAASVARALDRAGLRAGDRVLLLLPTCPTLVTELVGCLLRGICPLVGAPSDGLGTAGEVPDQTLSRSLDAGVSAVITGARRVASVAAQVGPAGPRVLAAEPLLHTPAVGSEDPRWRPQPDDVALLVPASEGQGAAAPLTHGALVAHLAALGQALRVGEREVLCGFAGLDRVQGLVDSLLFGLYHGFDQVLLAPDRIYARPVRWLGALSRFGCTLTLADSVAYGHCAHRCSAEDLRGLRLDSLRRAVAVGTPVRPGTQEAFVRRFRPLGLGHNIFLPAYSVAAAGGIVTLGRPGAHPLSDRFDRRSLSVGRYVHTAGTGDARGRLMMSCGEPLGGLAIGVGDDGGRALDEGVVGRIRLAPPTAAAPDTAWVESGDLGFFVQGELFVVGRAEQGLQLRGLRYDPEELESLVGEVPGLRSRGAAAFEVRELDPERPVLVAAPDRGLGAQRLEQLADRLEMRIGRMIGVRPQVVLVPRGALTGLGRGQAYRLGLRERYLGLGASARPPAEGPQGGEDGE